MGRGVPDRVGDLVSVGVAMKSRAPLLSLTPAMLDVRLTASQRVEPVPTEDEAAIDMLVRVVALGILSTVCLVLAFH